MHGANPNRHPDPNLTRALIPALALTLAVTLARTLTRCKELLRAAEELVKGPSEGRKNLDLLKGAAKLKMGGARAFAAAADLTKKHKEADPEGFAAKEVAEAN